MQRHWGIRVGVGGASDKYADLAREHSFVAIGWEEMGDLCWLRDAPEPKQAHQELLERYRHIYGASSAQLAMGASQLWRFVREMQAGDVVLLPHTSSGVIHLGEVAGPYEYLAEPSDGCPQHNCRQMRWLRTVSRRDLPQALLSTPPGSARPRSLHMGTKKETTSHLRLPDSFMLRGFSFIGPFWYHMGDLQPGGGNASQGPSADYDRRHPVHGMRFSSSERRGRGRGRRRGRRGRG